MENEKIITETFEKVRCAGCNSRYIDANGKWWQVKLNGKIEGARKMAIEKSLGTQIIRYIDSEIWGRREL